LLALEHPLINIIAIALITIGWSKHKNWWLVNQNLRLFYFYGLGLLLILSRIPENLLKDLKKALEIGFFFHQGA
jgi:hypothetical protein